MVTNYRTKPELINADALVRIVNRENQRRKVAFLADSNTAICCLPLLVNAGMEYLPENLFIVKSGERSKNQHTLNEIHKWMLQLHMRRTDLLVNLGGGMVTDIGGFAASVYMRGIDFYNIPTSLLAMVDASIGGKTAVNFENFKNYLGTFADPEHIYIVHSFLNTLPKNEWRSGLAEMVKHAILRRDYKWLADLHSARGTKLLNLSAEEIIGSANFKLEIVEQDPLERGVRKILNFGHTVGHAIEKVFFDTRRKVRHGDAVACGMYIAVRLSESMMNLNPETSHNLQDILLKYFPKVRIGPNDITSIISACFSDKKNSGEMLSFVLLDQNGHAKFNVPVDSAILRSELQLYSDS